MVKISSSTKIKKMSKKLVIMIVIVVYKISLELEVTI